MEYIADKIKDEYMDWKKGDRVFITAPTGSGKTTFILKRLLPYVCSRGERILYFVNRKILKKQIENELNEICLHKYTSEGLKMKKSIRVMTYQEFEKMNCDDQMKELNYGQYVVCDEAHYFCHDSLFNTLTCVSYESILLSLLDRITIFMSATIGNFRNQYNEALDSFQQVFRQDSQVKIENIAREIKWKGTKEYTYEGKKDYSYVDIKYFSSEEELCDIVLKASSEQKWLIFINDIKKGNEIKKTFKKSGRSVVFINSQYKEDEIADEEVNEITSKGTTINDIVIATSSLDNGVSILDERLRNVVIFADNEVEFIQMLGRKRNDGKTVLLYIHKKTKREFQRKLQAAIKVKAAYYELSKDINAGQLLMIMRKILTRSDLYQCCKQFLFIDEKEIYGRSHLQANQLSLHEIDYRIKHYEEQISKIENEGEYAYLKTQLEWLGMQSDEVLQKIINIENIEIDKLKSELEEIITEYVEKEIDSEENKKMKMSIRDPLRSLLRKLYTEDELGRLTENQHRPDATISQDVFNMAMERIDLPFYMEKKGNGKKQKTIFIIKNKNSEEKK